MNNILRTLLVLLLLLPLAACNTFADGSVSMAPASLDMKGPPGPPDYEQGYADGCESGSNAYSRDFYKMVKAFDYKFDVTKRNNKMYYQIWKDAFLYCSLYWERTNQPEI